MGLGDEILAAGVAEKIWRETGEQVAIVDEAGRFRNHAAWIGNPAICADGSHKLYDYPGKRGYLTGWGDGPRSLFNMSYRNADHPGRLFIPLEYREWAERHVPPGCIIIEPHVRHPSSPNKDWGPENWEDVGQQLDGYVVQIGDGNDYNPLVADAWIPTPTFWHAAAAIERAALVLTPEGGMHHMAGALRKPAVVIYGGFTHPQLTGYDWHTNLYVDIDGSPCGRFDLCPHCTEALGQITPEMVVKAAEDMLNAQRTA